MQVPRKIVKKTSPPHKAPQSRQYDLFSTFFGDPADLSNTIELWDAIPKYAVSPRTQNDLRSKEGRLPVYEQTFVYASRRSGHRVTHKCRVAIQPVPLKVKTADKETKKYAYEYLDFYPSKDEELVEEVIRKIFADQHFGIHDPSQSESWVRFSLQMIRKELQARSKTRSLDEIKRSLEILAKTHISLYLDDMDDPAYSAAILSDLTRVTRQKYLEDTTLTWIARLPALISKSVNELTYRQFNYGLLMSLSTQLARWLHKRLSHNYTNAGHMDPYEVLFSSIQRDSGLLTQERTNKKTNEKVPNTSANIQTLEAAFQELTKHSVLLDWKRVDERRQGRKILDIKYRLHAHPDFISDVKTANARLKQARTGSSKGPVDKLLFSGR